MNNRVQNAQRTAIFFDDIILSYDFVLLDTSALVSSLSFKRSGKSINERYLADCYQSSIFLIKYAEKKKFCVTPLVLQEYLMGCRELKEIIKIYHSNPKKSHYGKLIQLIESQCRESNNLARSLSMDNIIDLEDSERVLYEDITRRLDWIKNNYNLTETDTDFLASGIVVSKKRGSCALVSNDFGILKAWKDYIRFTRTQPRQFGFFIRGKIDSFIIQ